MEHARQSVQLRLAGSADVSLLLQLWKDAGATPSSTDNATALLNLLTYPHARVILAEIGARLVGSLIATSDGWRANMYRLAVHPEFRRRGLARRLVEDAETRLREIGVMRITALVESDHPDAVGLWESAGYESHVKMRRYYKNLAGS